MIIWIKKRERAGEKQQGVAEAFQDYQKYFPKNNGMRSSLMSLWY